MFTHLEFRNGTWDTHMILDCTVVPESSEITQNCQGYV
jgi:hypothetical protein